MNKEQGISSMPCGFLICSCSKWNPMATGTWCALMNAQDFMIPGVHKLLFLSYWNSQFCNVCIRILVLSTIIVIPLLWRLLKYYVFLNRWGIWETLPQVCWRRSLPSQSEGPAVVVCSYWITGESDICTVDYNQYFVLKNNVQFTYDKLICKRWILKLVFRKLSWMFICEHVKAVCFRIEVL